MARLNVVNPEKATGKVKEIFDGPLKGKHFNLFKGLANSPAALNFYLAMGGALKDAALSEKEREAIALAVGEANGCDYCVAAHTTLGKMAGLKEEQTLGARKGRVEGDAKLDALVRFATALHEKRGYVSDDDLKSFRDAGYNDGHVAEAVACYAQNVFTNYFNHVNESDIDFPAPPALS
ncbi:MAG: carboxymuconolactone decarboxylase family protein [Phycisphaerales bacterium]|nr:MAG: carboxymuconolactone decarboxylase family protein [Phycisphaerales bacterium]